MEIHQDIFLLPNSFFLETIWLYDYVCILLTVILVGTFKTLSHFYFILGEFSL